MKESKSIEKLSANKHEVSKIKGGLDVRNLLKDAYAYEIIGDSPYTTFVDGIKISSNDQP